jgi:hypothetical protein
MNKMHRNKPMSALMCAVQFKFQNLSATHTAAAGFPFLLKHEVLGNDGDQSSSSFVRDIAFCLAALTQVSDNVTTSPEKRKQSRAHARKSPSPRVLLPVTEDELPTNKCTSATAAERARYLS